jgi:ATP-dependent DNA helicase RecG
MLHTARPSRCEEPTRMSSHIDLKTLAARESEQVEWKKNVSDVEDVLRTITAFSNDLQNLGGGYIVCGAEETKDEHGFQKVLYPGLSSARLKELEGKVMADCRTKIDPAVVPLVEELPGDSEERRVLVFIVPATGSAHSYRASGKDAAAYYVRLSRETVEARNGVLRELLVRKQALPPWDRRLSERATLADIDLLALREILQQVGIWNASIGIEDYFSEQTRISEFVPPLGGRRGLDTNIHPRNFSVLLFGKEPTRFFPGAWTKVSIYPGNDRSELTAERHDLTGTVVTQARRALDLLKTHSSTLLAPR